MRWQSHSQKTDLAVGIVAEGRFAMKAIAETLEISRSNLLARMKGHTKPRLRYHKVQGAAPVPLVIELVSRRPSYGYRRITAVLN